MRVSDFLISEVKMISNDYRPGLTEISGVRDLVKGTALLAYSSMWRLVDSEDLGTGTPIASQAMLVSGALATRGIMKLALPIIFSIGYVIYQSKP